jgi:precorrin-6Y C5,15-methyltransferase (decarboxylating)
VLENLARPDAVFVGGGLDAPMFAAVWSRLASGARIVAHAVTLETEALIAELHGRHGGDLMRIEIARAAPLGSFRSWEASRPIVQWQAVKGEGA